MQINVEMPMIMDEIMTGLGNWEWFLVLILTILPFDNLDKLFKIRLIPDQMTSTDFSNLISNLFFFYKNFPINT